MYKENSSLSIAAAASQNIKEKDYWLQKLFDPPAPTGFPYIGPTGPTGAPGAAGELKTAALIFPDKLSAALIKISGNSEARLFIILAAGVTALIHKYNSKTDIIVGTSITKQEENLPLINTILPLRCRVESSMTFKELIYQIKETFFEAVENQDYPYEILLHQLGIPIRPAEPTLLEIAILLESIHDRRYIQKIHPNMIFSFRLSGDNIELTLEHNPPFYDVAAAGRIADHLENLLDKALAHVELPLCRLDILSDREKEQVLSRFNQTAACYPVEKPLHQLFQEQVEKKPDITAAVDTQIGMFVSYRALNRRANKLAALLHRQGLEPDCIVGIMTDQPIDMVPGMMAILKAGGAYLPLDHTYPPERVKYIIKDSNIGFLLINSRLIELNSIVFEGIASENIIRFEEEHLKAANISHRFPGTNSGNLAYVLYTSGTTGKPKGVMIEHKNVVNVLAWYSSTYDIKPGTRVLALSDYTFDPSVEDIWGTLLYGATLYIGSKELGGNREEFARYVEKYQVHLVDFVPTILKELLGSGTRLKSLKVVISGGEVLTDEVKQQIIDKGYRLYNHYGPTETTVDALAEECSPEPVTLGHPIANVMCYILDNFYNPLPCGIAGELFISGAGPGRGYLNNPGLTRQRFGENPFCPGLPIYQTGDLARHLTNGKIQFLGRIDRQVKIRGHRIELKEIEHCLLKHPHIKEAIVTASTNKKEDTCLYAYIIPTKQLASLESGELREYLSQYLPSYMIPRYFRQMETFPLTPHGKIDMKSLLMPGAKTGGTYTTPADKVEEKLIEIWSEVLEIEKHLISVDSNFFELGGHSLKAGIIAKKVNKLFNLRVPLVEIFKRVTIRQFAQYIKNENGEIFAVKDEYLVLLKKISGNAPHLFLIHDGSGDVDVYIEFCNLLTAEYNCWGIRTYNFNNYSPMNLSIQDIGRSYMEKIKMVQSSGPYFLGGYSIGGTVAFEIALHLEKMEEKISFLGLIDAPGPRENWLKGMTPFNVQSEMAWLRELLPDKEIKKKLKKVVSIDQIWPTIIKHLEENHYSAEVIKKLITGNLVKEIPNYHQQGARELIYYLNLNRTLGNALAFYYPANQIQAPVHYIEARQSPKIARQYWKDYCHKSIQFHDISGDHFSILVKPNVVQTARIFDRILHEIQQRKVKDKIKS